jgi:hypothetical protein
VAAALVGIVCVVRQAKPRRPKPQFNEAEPPVAR